MTLETHNGPKFDIDFKRGKVGEDSHKDFLVGKHEVKTDYKTIETGNFYIEYSQLNNNGYKPSGIDVTESDFWVQASPLGKGGIWVKIEVLRELVSENNFPIRSQPIRNADTNASVGYLIPITSLLQKLGFVP
jgi:predicted RNA-binding protein with PIN domain